MEQCRRERRAPLIASGRWRKGQGTTETTTKRCRTVFVRACKPEPSADPFIIAYKIPITAVWMPPRESTITLAHQLGCPRQIETTRNEAVDRDLV